MVVKVARASAMASGHGLQVVAEQDHVGGDDGHVGARTQGQAELGGGVVDTVSDHGYRTALPLHLLNDPGLGRGQRLGEDLVDPRRRRPRPARWRRCRR
jgi:hypothetical protein